MDSDYSYEIQMEKNNTWKQSQFKKHQKYLQLRQEVSHFRFFLIGFFMSFSGLIFTLGSMGQSKKQSLKCGVIFSLIIWGLVLMELYVISVNGINNSNLNLFVKEILSNEIEQKQQSFAKAVETA